jgi:glycosyltransferase involved in cell wall biosynthesis
MELNSIGVVAIGRNEGDRLKSCLQSIIKPGNTIVYVDSGSSDGSVALAHSLGVAVVELDLSIPFTAARARNAGWEYLLQHRPDIEFVQFVDGDCWVAPGWWESALKALATNPQVVVVCGRRREEFPHSSVYNALFDVEWNTPIGQANYCGGDSMMRVTALKQVGGFNPGLIAGEEPELCIRLRRQGGTILRIDADMTWHDAQMTRLSQWQKRAIRSGYGYAEGAWLHGWSPERHWVRENLRICFWGLILPVFTAIALLPTKGWSIVFLLAAYSLLFYRIYIRMRLKSCDRRISATYALLCILDKYPMVQGQIRFYLGRLFKRQSKIVEYKSVLSGS